MSFAFIYKPTLEDVLLDQVSLQLQVVLQVGEFGLGQRAEDMVRWSQHGERTITSQGLIHTRVLCVFVVVVKKVCLWF